MLELAEVIGRVQRLNVQSNRDRGFFLGRWEYWRLGDTTY
jgi:hypothetical protein